MPNLLFYCYVMRFKCLEISDCLTIGASLTCKCNVSVVWAGEKLNVVNLKN